MNGISEIKTYILTKFWLAVFTVTYGMFSFLILFKRYTIKLIENQIWKYFPGATNVQVILATCWLLKPVSEFVQISLVMSPSITRQTFLYRSPQQSNRFRIVSEMNSIGFWSLYFQNLVKYRYWASGKYSGQDLWSLANEKFLLNFQKLTLNLNSMTFKFPEFCPDCQNVLLSESNINDSFVNTSSQFSAWFTTDAISVSPCQVSIPEQYSFSAAEDNVL